MLLFIQWLGYEEDQDYFKEWIEQQQFGRDDDEVNHARDREALVAGLKEWRTTWRAVHLSAHDRQVARDRWRGRQKVRYQEAPQEQTSEQMREMWAKNREYFLHLRREFALGELAPHSEFYWMWRKCVDNDEGSYRQTVGDYKMYDKRQRKRKIATPGGGLRTPGTAEAMELDEEDAIQQLEKRGDQRTKRLEKRRNLVIAQLKQKQRQGEIGPTEYQNRLDAFDASVAINPNSKGDTLSALRDPKSQALPDNLAQETGEGSTMIGVEQNFKRNAIRRLARRAGAKRVSATIYSSARVALHDHLKEVLTTISHLAEHKNGDPTKENFRYRKMRDEWIARGRPKGQEPPGGVIRSLDVIRALKHIGKPIFGVRGGVGAFET